jgi:hypothetical protein
MAECGGACGSGLWLRDRILVHLLPRLRDSGATGFMGLMGLMCLAARHARAVGAMQKTKNR